MWWCPDNNSPLPRRERIDTLMRTLLAPTLGMAPEALRFAREEKGRPFLDHPGAPDFNLSDTDGGSLVAISAAGRIGVDLERLDRVPPSLRLAERWFSRDESAGLATMAPDDVAPAFLHLWTAKEASCKATGTGIYGFLPLWTFDPGQEQPCLQALPADAGDAGRWKFLRVRPSPWHTAVIALRDVADYRLRCFTMAID